MGRHWGVDMFKIGETRTHLVGVRRETHELPSYLDHFFSPGITPATPSFLPFRGQTSNLSSALNNFSKTGAICLKRPGFPAARADFVRDFHGDGMGSVKIKRRALDRVQGENFAWEDLVFLDYFVQVLTIPVPLKERE